MADNNNNNTAIQVHKNPDPEEICEIEEDTDVVEEIDKRAAESENFYSVKGSTISPEEQQKLENVNDSTQGGGYKDSPDLPLLPSDDINEPNESAEAEDVENSNKLQSSSANDTTTNKEISQQGEELDYETSKTKVTPVPVVIDEGYDQGVNDGQQDLKASANAHGSDDKCCQFRCCGCPNGGFQILFCQFFLWCGLMLCSWGMSDCKFVEATAGYPEAYYPEIWSNWYSYPGAPPTPAPSMSPTLEPRPNKRRGFGMFFNETEQGGCGFTNPEGRYYHEEEFRNYLDFLGSDWNIPRIVGLIALGIGWMLFFGTFLLWCCSFIRPIRLLGGTILLLIVAGLQSATFAVIGSSFCEEEDFTNCEPARGWWMMLSGICCYLLSGILFCTTKDFPGPVA